MATEQPDDATILRRYGIEPDPVIEAYKKDVDRTLLRGNLQKTLEKRFDNAMQLQRFADEMRRAGRAARMTKFRSVLESLAPGPPKHLEAIAELEALLAESERARG